MDFRNEDSKPFPDLPILNPAIARRTEGERYGTLFYLGIAGLVFLITLIGWFCFGVWQNRELWADVYVLHDSARTEEDRVAAAMRLCRGSSLGDTQLMEMSLRRDLPDRARYVLAEAVSTDAVALNPRGYALAVARSADWPDWLRLLLARPLAYGAGRRYAIPREALEELARHSDAMIGLWAKYALAVGDRSSVGDREALEEAARGKAPSSELATMLCAALESQEPERSRILDRATLWLRSHHAQAIRIWEGWPPRAANAPGAPAAPSSRQPLKSGSG